MMPELLEGQRILVLEDEYLVARDMQRMIEDRGGEVVGPLARLDQALAVVQSEDLDGAVLDVNLYDGHSFPVADCLMAKGVPIIFATGYDISRLPDRFANVPTLAKPFSETASERIFQNVFAEGGSEKPSGSPH